MRKRRELVSLFFLLFSSPWRAYAWLYQERNSTFSSRSSMRLLHDHKAKLVRLTTGRRRKSVGEHQQAPVEFALLHIPIHTLAIVVVMPKLRERDVTRDEDENTMRTRVLSRSLVCDVVNNIKFMFRNMKLHVGQHENESMLTWRSRCYSDGVEGERIWTRKAFFVLLILPDKWDLHFIRF